MATTSKASILTPALNAAFNPTNEPSMQQKLADLATAIDNYIVDVASKMTGTVSTSAAPLFAPAVVVPLDGGASLLASMISNAAAPLTGTISSGNISTN